MLVGVGAGVDELADDDGDVVVAPGLQREPDELGGGVVDGLQRERLADRRVVDHVGEAVAAQQEAVAEAAVVPVEVGLVVVAAQHDPQQEGAVRVDARLLAGDLALVDEALDERVVVADLVQLAVAQEVGARVADVGGGEALAVPQHRLERRAHALDGRVLADEGAEALVGVGDGALEGVERVDVAQVAVQLADDVHRLGRGEVARGGAAHPVGDGDEPAARVAGVLVGGPAQADVGQGDVVEPQGRHRHFRSSTTVLPSRTWMPRPTGTGLVMRWLPR